MTNTIIYNSIFSDIVYSDWFIKCDYFYLEAFNIGGGELETDAYLNVEITENDYRVIPIVRQSDNLNVNLIDTETLFTLPTQFRESTLRKRIVLVGGNGESIRLTIVRDETPSDRVEVLSNEIKLLSQVNLAYANYNSQLQLQQNSALISFALALGAVMPTRGSSLTTLPSTVLPILSPIPVPTLPLLLP